MNNWEFPVVSDLRYHTLLNTLSRRQLLDICDYIKVINRSQLKKSDLKSILHSDIYLYLDKYILAMNDGQLHLLSRLLEMDHLPLEAIPVRHLQFFLQLGIVYPVTYNHQSGLFIPKEIKQWIIKRLTPSLMNLFDRNNRVVSFVYHCIDAYGLMEYQSFFYFYHLRHPDDDIFHEFELILQLEADFNGRYICDDEYFYNASLKDSLQTFKAIRLQYKNIGYYSYDGSNGTDYQEDEVMKQLSKSIMKLSEKEREHLLHWAIDLFNHGYTLSELEKRLLSLEQFPKRLLGRFYRALSNQYPYLRLWIYKGNRFIDCQNDGYTI